MFGKRLRELRKAKKLTMKELGAKFNLAESTISGYETGNRKPDLDQIKKFSEYFGVTIDYLVGETNDSSLSDSEKDFQEFLEDPELGLWFKELKSSPEEQVEELRKIWEIIKSRETGKNNKDKTS